MKGHLIALSLFALPLVSGAADETWPLYSPGSVPSGRMITVSDAPSLPRDLSEPVYIKGDFIVTASSPTRVVLRSAGATHAMPPVRIIVNFPPGIPTPAVKTVFTRGEDSPFQILRVEHSPDGASNVYAREIVR